MPVTSLSVFLAALLTAVATGLGALPFLAVPDMSRTWLGLSNALAAGLMLAASALLLYEGVFAGPIYTAIGTLAGIVFVAFSEWWMEGYDDVHVGRLQGADALKVLLIVGVMTVHSFTEGVGVGVSYGDTGELGGLITAAIALHNVPEGLAISLVMIPRGASVPKAGAWSIFSSLPQPLVAVPAFLFVDVFHAFLPLGLGFAGGAMIWMSVSELLPDALEDAPRRWVVASVLGAGSAMLVFQWLLRG